MYRFSVVMELVEETVNPKKKPRLGRLTEVKKQLLTHSHEVGPNCHCSRLKCYEVIQETERKQVNSKFNQMTNYDEQNLYLGGLITVSLVKQRRPRNDEPEHHSYSYSYKIRFIKNDSLKEVPVCYKAFIAIHGITARRVQTLQSMLTTKGGVVKDGRGKHKNRPHQLSQETVGRINEHIQSLKGRRSHYSRHDSKKIYLPETLDIKKLHSLYNTANPNNQTSYDSYRNIFNTKYNISFGYPRTDSCSSCDEFKAKVQSLQNQINNAKNDAVALAELQAELQKIETEHEVHLRKADAFYSRKRMERKLSQKNKAVEAICMDYQKNLNCPNISTNDVYYRRQLSFYLFNIHTLSTQESIFYTYDQTIAKKGSDDVTSILYNFVLHFLDKEVRHLTIFCDSCGGQNKNFTLFRFAYFIVHVCGRLDTLKMVFPVRGHSYMECDRNMGLINQKSYIEVPDDWVSVIANARVKPSPFSVVKCDQSMFFSWSDFFEKLNFSQKCPFKSRPIKEFVVDSSKPGLVMIRDSYNAAFQSIVMTTNEQGNSSQTSKKQKSRKSFRKEPAVIMSKGLPMRPEPLYTTHLPVPIAKYKDLQHLKKFISPEGQAFYNTLTSTTTQTEDEDEAFG